MIQNDRELEITTRILTGLKESFEKDDWKDQPAWHRKAVKDGLKSVIEEMEEDINEYQTKRTI